MFDENKIGDVPSDIKEVLKMPAVLNCKDKDKFPLIVELITKALASPFPKKDQELLDRIG